MRSRKVGAGPVRRLAALGDGLQRFAQLTHHAFARRAEHFVLQRRPLVLSHERSKLEHPRRRVRGQRLHDASPAVAAHQLTDRFQDRVVRLFAAKAFDALSARDAKLAMAMMGKSRHYRRSTIQRRHFNATARLCGYGPDAEDVVASVLDRTPGVIARMEAQLPTGFPPKVPPQPLRWSFVSKTS